MLTLWTQNDAQVLAMGAGWDQAGDVDYVAASGPPRQRGPGADPWETRTVEVGSQMMMRRLMRSCMACTSGSTAAELGPNGRAAHTPAKPEVVDSWS